LKKDAEEATCLAWALHDEARGEPIKGQRAVYDVIKHRMTVRSLTACEVVKQPYQFSGYKRGMKLRADDDMLQRLDEVRRMRPVVPSATYFHSKAVKPSWAAKMKRILSIGGHVFYRPKPKEKQK
jgi:spore germination cell wall hydrolase CwlJ-like protein